MFSDRSGVRCLTSNHLLAAPPTEVLQRWTPRLEWVDTPPGQVLQEAGQVMRYVYFPTTAIVSLMHLTAEGDSAEIAVVGNDGLVGISLFTGGDTALRRAVVESSGGGFQLRREIIMAEFDRLGTAMRLLLRYTQAQITQIAQPAACNRHHTLDQQLSRWLLHRQDRLEGNELQMTQELIGALLGVRRESVAAGIARLQHTGLIRHRVAPSRCSTAPGWNGARASAMQSSERTPTACCLRAPPGRGSTRRANRQRSSKQRRAMGCNPPADGRGTQTRAWASRTFVRSESRHPTAVLQKDSVSNHAIDWKHLSDLRSRAAARPTGSLRRCGTRMGDANAPRRDWVSRPSPLACSDCSRTEPQTDLNVSRHMNPLSCQ